MTGTATSPHSPNDSPLPSPTLQGWQCPHCRRVNAPWQPQCPCSPPGTYHPCPWAPTSPYPYPPGPYVGDAPPPFVTWCILP